MWLSVWSRAVIAPAVRRALAVWLGAGIVAAMIFGPNAMKARDLTGLALHDPAAGAVVGVTWLLLFVPTARILVRGDGASYLRTLPHAAWPPRLLATAALVGLQLPWVALWLAGEGARGLVVVGAATIVVVALAAWRPRRARARAPSWRGPLTALAGVYVRGVLRRAGDALVRGAGLSVLAGVAGALMVRNNGVAGAHAAALATGAISIVLVPAVVGALLPLRDAHRSSAALAASLGIVDRSRVAVLAAVLGGVYALGAMIAGGIAVVITGEWIIVPVAIAAAIGAGLMTSSTVASADNASRIVVRAIVAAAITVVWIGWLGATGAVLALATGIVALSRSA